jgi:uncharacterized protein
MAMNYKKAEKYIIRRLEKELPEGLYYHGLHHTLDVLDATIRLARMEKVSKEELIMLKTAALYHDAGFIEKYFLNEEVGARIAKKSLLKFGYNPKQIKTISNIILATRIEAQPNNRLEEIIRDADLDYLGRDDFGSIAESLKNELYDRGLKYNAKQWNKIMIDFLEKHTYYTESAKKTRNGGKLKHIKQLKKSSTTQ